MLMNQRHLQLFRLVVTHGSFAAAAEKAAVSPSAVSQAMRALEQEWQVPLFQRQGRRKLPLPAALRAAALLADVDSRLNLALRPCAAPDRPSGHLLRVGAGTGPALLYGPAIEKAWRAHAPRGVLQFAAMSPQDMLSALKRRELDFAITPLPRRHPTQGLDRLCLHHTHMCIMARPSHPLNKATSLEELASARWAMSYRLGDLSVIEEAFRVRQMPPPHAAVECSDFGALIHLVARSDLLCVVPHPILLDLAASRTLVQLEIREGLPRYDIFLFWNSGVPPSTGMLSVIETLRRQPLPI